MNPTKTLSLPTSSIMTVLAVAALLAVHISHAQTVQMKIVGGHLTLTDTTQLNGPSSHVSVEDGATVTLGEATVLTAQTVTIRSGGLLQGCGTVNANVSNLGTILANCGVGSRLLFSQVVSIASGAMLRGTDDCQVEFGTSVVNNGLIQLLGGSHLTFGGQMPFTNFGIIDLINGDADTLPTGFSPGGTLYTADQPPGLTLASNTAGDKWEITIEGIQGHRYNLQTCTSLGPDTTWTTIDTRQATTIAPIIFEQSILLNESVRFWAVTVAESNN